LPGALHVYGPLCELADEGVPAVAGDGEKGAVVLLAVTDGSASGGGVGDLDAFT
jgi:hypothetical protein